ncbi:hypothetical protein PLEOSDRAFT_1105755 [Pleurotus ostreatus PC15]|uniref:Uncharacterized protein n=1 Tax=Pleurotus ostreatus (strain PC15) TaxID=1137138 RepID=A0A067NRZ5_PLEO1|nr:hypothetical protein PLEOSDRAFT_1105755 [Pleurotus ostreatus PC15]
MRVPEAHERPAPPRSLHTSSIFDTNDAGARVRAFTGVSVPVQSSAVAASLLRGSTNAQRAHRAPRHISA